MYPPELIEFLSLDIPQAKTVDDGFLDITGQQYRENTISRIYAYFLDSKKNKEIAELFISSLLDIIEEKTKTRFHLDSFYCNTEEGTNIGNRIDLFIHSAKDKKCIIIENKIFHHLNNDLLDYWNHKGYKDCNKVGIVLTLNNHAIPENAKGKFINIKHIEWVRKIRGKGIPSTLTPKEFIYLSDFLKNMENITESDHMENDVRFFFENSEKVRRATATWDAAFDFVIKQLQKVAAEMNWELSGSNDDYRHLGLPKSSWDVYYAIIIKDLFTAKSSVMIIIELYKDAVAKEGRFIAALSGNAQFQKLQKDGDGDKGWKHFLYESYDVTTEQKADLAKFIKDRIDADFKSTMDILLEENKRVS